MAQQANLQAATRSETGKGAARSLRRAGKVPGVIYGHGRAPEALAVETSALNKMLVGISAGTTIVDVAIDDRPPVKVLIREIQRDALRPAQILHLDFYEVRADEKITLEVGANYQMKIIKLSPSERKIGLSIRALKSDEFRTDWETYQDGEGTGTATLGDHFRNR